LVAAWRIVRPRSPLTANIPNTELGADVTATYNASSSNLDALADAQSDAATSSSALGKLIRLRCDLTDESSVDELFQTAEQLAGKPVTILVRKSFGVYSIPAPHSFVFIITTTPFPPFPPKVNHAIYESTPSPIATMSLSQFRRTIDVNLTSSFIVLKAFLARLKRAKEQGEREVLDGNVSVVMVGSTGESRVAFV
jgi:NAD(P)-dependent dehydrogenase (short-subunit alcohol dehydrogenase family)